MVITADGGYRELKQCVKISIDEALENARL
jgi:hypothetical protein